MPSKILKSLNQSFSLHWIRHCAVCGSARPPIEWLCSFCLKKLSSFFIEPKNMIRLQFSFRHARLIDWSSKNDYFIRSVIQSLKGTANSPLFSLLAKEFFFRIKQLPLVLNDQPFVFIPCPPRIPKENLFSFSFLREPPLFDHGFFWAKALSEQTGWPVNSSLSRQPENKSQKKKNITARRQAGFLTSKKERRFKNHSVIFADDVVTSGATAAAAKLALNSPACFMVWSLFWRKPRTDEARIDSK